MQFNSAQPLMNLRSALNLLLWRGATAICLLCLTLFGQQTRITRPIGNNRRTTINSSSPMYHRWLTPEQYGVRFGASQNDLEKISDWLGSNGLQVIQCSAASICCAFPLNTTKSRPLDTCRTSSQPGQRCSRRRVQLSLRHRIEGPVSATQPQP